MPIAGQMARVRVSGPAVPFAGAAAEGDDGRTEYRVIDPALRVWAPAEPLTVERSTDDGVSFAAVPQEEYRANRLAGAVVFGAVQPEGTMVRVGGAYLPLSVAAEAREFSYSLQGTSAEAPRFGESHVRRAPVLRDVTGSLAAWTTADRYFEDALTSGEPVVLEFFSDGDGEADLRAWARLASTEMRAAVDGLGETSVEWEGAPDAEGRSISHG
jgi:hypothetical protein